MTAHNSVHGMMESIVCMNTSRRVGLRNRSNSAP